MYIQYLCDYTVYTQERICRLFMFAHMSGVFYLFSVSMVMINLYYECLLIFWPDCLLFKKFFNVRWNIFEYIESNSVYLCNCRFSDIKGKHILL